MTTDAAPRRRRADAVRNTEAVLEAAKTAFADLGVDAPVREIASRAGVGVGTIYRAYPQRSDLVIAVFRREVDATAAEALRLAREEEPPQALRRWARRLEEFVTTKRGFADALHSGDPAYEPLPAYFIGTVAPSVQAILDAGARGGSIRDDVRAEGLVLALARLSGGHPDHPGEDSTSMIEVLLDGVLR